MTTSMMRGSRALAIATALALPLALTAPARAGTGSASSALNGLGSPYTWRNVTIGAGGFITGVVYNPTKPGLAYLRTDIGGLYRWNASAQTWIPLLDFTTIANSNQLGVESVATDPIHPNVVWAAVGAYADSWNAGNNGAILRSDNYGKTWTTTELPIMLGSNDQGRDSGERLAVDPNDDNILYFASRNNGLWKSSDGGVTWAQDTAFPDLGDNTDSGLQFVTFNTSEKHLGTPTRQIFVGDADKTALYSSDDAGATWTTVSGGPAGMIPIKDQISADGQMYVVYDTYTGPYWTSAGRLYEFDLKTGTSKDISPVDGTFGYDGLSVDPRDPNLVAVATEDRWSPVDTVYVSNDAGATWDDMSANDSMNIGYEPYLSWGGTPKFGWWIAAVAIDPFDPNHLVYGTGATLYGTDDLGAVSTGGTVDITASASKGIEETSVQDLLVPNSTAKSACLLVSAVGDLGGFCHTSLTTSPTDFFDAAVNTGSGTAQDASGSLIAFVGEGGGSTAIGRYSTDGGATWTDFTKPGTMTWGQGKVAVSADGSTILWNPADGSSPVYSTDKGATWTAVTGLPTGVTPVADTVNSADFYAIDAATGVLYTSTDGGATFTVKASGLTAAGNDQILPTPGKTGDLYFAAQSGGLLHSTDGGATWTALDASGPSVVTAADAIGTGAAAPGSACKTLYLVGTVNGATGFFMSTDDARSWTRINSDQQNFAWISVITGDPHRYGRVYVGTNGRGIETIDVAG